MPFGRNLAPGMLHRNPGHGEAIARITWCVDQHAVGLIPGEVGAGKTVAVRAATAALDPSRHVVIYLPNPSIGVRGMLHHIVSALGQIPSFYTATLAPQAADALAAEHAERGRTPVVVIDEAHLLDKQQLEAIRMLTNHDMDSGSPFAAVLIGQPTLRHRLRLGVLAALDQRISVRYALAGMTAEDTASTIRISWWDCMSTTATRPALAAEHRDLAVRGEIAMVEPLAIGVLHPVDFVPGHRVVPDQAAQFCGDRDRVFAVR